VVEVCVEEERGRGLYILGDGEGYLCQELGFFSFKDRSGLMEWNGKRDWMDTKVGEE
jgi:hypothetical protein